MTEFIKMYHNDPEGAKNMYYKAKLKFDGSSNEGHSKKKRMLKKYIEGL
jgi:5'-3' exonuclease